MRFLKDINYNLQGYYKKQTFDSFGDLIVVEYYKNYTEGVYSNIQVRETRVYTRDPSTQLLISRQMKIDWLSTINKGVEQIIATKTTIKHYTPQQGLVANKRAWSNIIDIKTTHLIKEMGYDEAINFIATVQSEIKTYIDLGIKDPLINKIELSQNVLINDKLKTEIINILDV